jgi:hypothetical protein
MNYLDILITLLRWKDHGWEVHPIDLTSEFRGWF